MTRSFIYYSKDYCNFFHFDILYPWIQEIFLIVTT